MKKVVQTEGLEYIYHDGETYCIILRDNFQSSTLAFVTPDDFSMQLGFLPHKQGNVIQPHMHKPAAREIVYTNEVLIVKKGRVKVNLYDTEKNYLGSETLHDGDSILLNFGGHGFEVEQDTVMIEVKQGPYMGMADKERFQGVEGDSGR